MLHCCCGDSRLMCRSEQHGGVETLARRSRIRRQDLLQDLQDLLQKLLGLQGIGRAPWVPEEKLPDVLEKVLEWSRESSGESSRGLLHPSHSRFTLSSL